MYVGNDLLNQLINQQEEETKHKNEIIIGGEKKIMQTWQFHFSRLRVGFSEHFTCRVARVNFHQAAAATEPPGGKRKPEGKWRYGPIFITNEM